MYGTHCSTYIHCKYNVVRTEHKFELKKSLLNQCKSCSEEIRNRNIYRKDLNDSVRGEEGKEGFRPGPRLFKSLRKEQTIGHFSMSHCSSDTVVD